MAVAELTEALPTLQVLILHILFIFNLYFLIYIYNFLV